MSDKEIDSGILADRGLKFTKIYLLLLVGGIPIAATFGIIDFHQLKLNELGDFLAGAFGPLAIFWLVLGFFQQGKELRNSVDALKLQAEELKNSVEQQKAMVKITDQQLQLDIDVRAEQNLLSRSKELPLFQLQSLGNSPVQNSSGRRYKYRMTNIGAAAASVRAYLNSDEVEFHAPEWAFTENGTSKEFEVKTLQGPNFPDGASLHVTIESFNIRSQKRTQTFSIGNFAPKQLRCDPETR